MAAPLVSENQDRSDFRGEDGPDLPHESGVTTTPDNGSISIDLNNLLSGLMLPALPQSAVRLLEMSQDLHKGPKDFADVLENDPALATQVLRFVNSSYFGFRNRLSSVRHGIVLVGMRTIKNFVLWTAIFGATPNPKCSVFSLQSFRGDALRRGLFAKALGKLLDAEGLEETFTAALLQDIALPFLVKELPELYSDLLQKRQDGRVRLSQLEQEKFGWTHSDAACALFERWNLPEEFCNLVRSHTEADKLIAQPDRSAKSLVVALSSMLPADGDDEWHDCERLEEYYQQIKTNRATTLQELMGRRLLIRRMEEGEGNSRLGHTECRLLPASHQRHGLDG